MSQVPQQVQVTITDPNSTATITNNGQVTTISWPSGQQVQVTAPAGVPVVQQVQV
jgi:hypothetical protein